MLIKKMALQGKGGESSRRESLNGHGASSTPKRRSSHLLQRQEEEAIGSLYRLSSRPASPRSQLEQEKRIRREIANSNERRRMQSINTGFNSLRTMLPKHDGEKLSKAAILQHTAEYIDHLEQEKTRLLAHHCQLKRVIGSMLNGQGNEVEGLIDSQLVKRLKTEHVAECSNSDSSDEGIQCHPSPQVIDTEPSVDELRSELVEVRKAVDRERRLRMQLEEQVKALEAQLYPERVKEIAQQVQVKFQTQDSENGQIASESEDANAVASLVDDEVIAETIEIETHSCPGSPQMQPTTIVIQAPSESCLTSSSSIPLQIHSTQSSRIFVATREMTSATANIPNTTSSKIKNSSKIQQPAAIALPIDVPFIGSSGGSGGTVTLQIIGPASVADQAQNASSTSRHNLETIVEAIRHLEGDHLFKDDENQTVVVKQDFDESEIITAQMEEVETRTSSNESTMKTVHTVNISPEQMGAIRQKVIQCIPMSGQARPGVIVAKNS